MSFTVDIWCDPQAKDQPQSIESGADPEDSFGESDPCNIYVSMEHVGGCIYYDFTSILQVTGAFMIFFGLLLMICGMRAQKVFMQVIVRLAAFAITCTLFYKLHYFAYFDPSEPDERKQIPLALFALIMAFLM